MTGTQFVKDVKAKLNRIDSSAYEDVRQEEVIFFANEALKTLTLEFDIGVYSKLLDKHAIEVYLGSLTASKSEENLVNSAYALDGSVFKFKDVEVFVTINSETGWMSAYRMVDNNKTSDRQTNPFKQAYADTPTYRFIDGSIKFDSNGFTCSKIRYDYLKYPETITLASNLTYTFLNELQDKTVTLIVENLEAQRLRTQPLVSRT